MRVSTQHGIECNTHILTLKSITDVLKVDVKDFIYCISQSFFIFTIMRMIIVMLLFLSSYFGWIALGVLSFSHTIADKWYIAIPLFIIATAWGLWMHRFAQRYRDKK